MKNKALNCALFSFGYGAYSLIELAYRKYTHFTMGIAGGVCFTTLYHVFRRLKSATVLKKCLIGSGIITAVEFVFGCVLNLFLRLNIWDYSTLPFNLLGQICLLYSFLWALLCIPICYLSKIIERIYIAK